jgi:uncharacterized protein (DUF488 family)
MISPQVKRRANRSEEKKSAKASPLAVRTIGNSTRTLDQFLNLLQAHAATFVADVRTAPRSRHNLRLNKASLPRFKKKTGLRCVYIPGLGGLRHAKRNSVNVPNKRSVA